MALYLLGSFIVALAGVSYLHYLFYFARPGDANINPSIGAIIAIVLLWVVTFGLVIFSILSIGGAVAMLTRKKYGVYLSFGALLFLSLALILGIGNNALIPLAYPLLAGNLAMYPLLILGSKRVLQAR